MKTLTFNLVDPIHEHLKKLDDEHEVLLFRWAEEYIDRRNQNDFVASVRIVVSSVLDFYIYPTTKERDRQLKTLGEKMRGLDRQIIEHLAMRVSRNLIEKGAIALGGAETERQKMTLLQDGSHLVKEVMQEMLACTGSIQKEQPQNINRSRRMAVRFIQGLALAVKEFSDIKPTSARNTPFRDLVANMLPAVGYEATISERLISEALSQNS